MHGHPGQQEEHASPGGSPFHDCSPPPQDRLGLHASAAAAAAEGSGDGGGRQPQRLWRRLSEAQRTAGGGGVPDVAGGWRESEAAIVAPKAHRPARKKNIESHNLNPPHLHAIPPLPRARPPPALLHVCLPHPLSPTSPTLPPRHLTPSDGQFRRTGGRTSGPGCGGPTARQWPCSPWR